MPIQVRQAQASDQDVIADYNCRLARESEAKTLDQNAVRAGIAAVLADPSKGRYFLAELEGRVVGQLAITFEWSDWRNGWFWWLQSVYVEIDSRRRGVFRALLEHVRQAARQDDDVIGLRLYVERDNLPAREAYRSLGLEETGYQVLEAYPL